MKKIFLRFGFLLWAVMLSGVEASFASEDKCIPARPSSERLVNNLSKEFPQFISVEEQAALETKLQNFSDETSNQIAIVIVDDLCGYDVSDFSFRLFDKWGMGQDKIDNGILIIIQPTGGPGNRDEGIVVGRGLEGAIPDLVTAKIRTQEMIPFFKQEKYYDGLDAAVNVLMGFAKGEYNTDEYARQNNPTQGFSWLAIIIIIVILLIFLLPKRKGTTIGGGRTYYGGGWSSWGGGGSFGGEGGGGFGGFGGGSTGGGGSFGKW